MAVAKHRGSGYDHSVVEVEVNVGHMKILPDDEDDQSGLWFSQGHHTCRTEHPGWVGHDPFMEWCVKDISRLRIVG
jgi:hypothetical protein